MNCCPECQLQAEVVTALEHRAKDAMRLVAELRKMLSEAILDGRVHQINHHKKEAA